MSNTAAAPLTVADYLRDWLAHCVEISEPVAAEANGNILGTITGSVTGTTMAIVFTYKVSPYTGEITTYVAKISASGNSLVAGTPTYAIPPNPSNGVITRFSAVRGTNVTCGTHGGNLGCEALLSTTICAKDFGATACKRARAHITKLLRRGGLMSVTVWRVESLAS
jgi:hypothetical protein